MSPGNKWRNKPQFSVKCLSLTRPPQPSEIQHRPRRTRSPEARTGQGYRRHFDGQPACGVPNRAAGGSGFRGRLSNARGGRRGAQGGRGPAGSQRPPERHDRADRRRQVHRFGRRDRCRRAARPAGSRATPGLRATRGPTASAAIILTFPPSAGRKTFMSSSFAPSQRRRPFQSSFRSAYNRENVIAGAGVLS